ncbi:MAG: hypothetical protein QOF02_3209 [Blastocatellia bacterium]|jgi:hypothetical protein|nr:hypothetical protein [Blastocatellia bacterium]
MTLNIESIGFPIGGAYSYLMLHQQIWEHGKIIPTLAGTYRLFAPGSGIEVWAKQDALDQLGHLHPHFSGGARMRVALVEKRPADTALTEGLFVAYFKHKEGEGIESVHERLRYGDGTYTGVIPFVFASPDYHCYAQLPMPIVTNVQITAFPFMMKGYETEDDWIDWQLEVEKRMRAEKGEPEEDEDDDGGYLAGASFMPSTMLFEKESPDDFPSPTAQLSGIVLETAIITNPVTEQDFSWARLETAAGEIDMVVSTELLEGYLVEGGVAAGHCLLSGRLPDFAPDIE